MGLGALGSCFESQHQLGSLALIYVHVLAVYYGVSYYLHYVSPQRHTKNVRSPAATQPEAQTERDALRAVFPLAIKALCLWGAHALHTCGWGIMSDGPILASWGVVDLLKAAATVLALDFFHDTWFYFVHRWLHTPTMMRYVLPRPAPLPLCLGRHAPIEVALLLPCSFEATPDLGGPEL